MKIRTFLDRALHFGGYGCSDTEQLLFAYVQEELAEPIVRKLEKHLANCPGCLRFVRSYQRTIEATREFALPNTPLPYELQRRLHDFIHQNPGLR